MILIFTHVVFMLFYWCMVSWLSGWKL